MKRILTYITCEKFAIDFDKTNYIALYRREWDEIDKIKVDYWVSIKVKCPCESCLASKGFVTWQRDER